MKKPFVLKTLAAAMAILPLSQAALAEEGNKQSLMPETVIIGDVDAANALAGSNAVITPEEIERNYSSDVLKILDTVPGVHYVQEDGMGLRPNIMIRSATGYRSSKVNLMEDGVLISPGPYASPAAYYSPVALRMYSFEVLKGANLLRYGPNTTGGAVNYISTPIPESGGGKVMAQVNNFGTMDLHAIAGFGAGSLAGSFETVQRVGKTFKELYGTNDKGVVRVQDYVSKLRWDANDSNSFLLKAQFSRERSDETYVGLTNYHFDEDPNMRYPMTEPDSMKNHHTGVNLTHHLLLGDNAELTTTIYHNKTYRNWYKLHSIARTSLVDRFRNNPDVLLGRADFAGLPVKENARTYKSSGIQTNFGLALGSHNFDIGMRYHEDEVDRYQPVDIYNQVGGKMVFVQRNYPGPGSNDNRLETADAVSFWLTDNWQVSDKLDLNFALRNETVKTERKQFNDAAKKDEDTRKARENDHSTWLPGASLAYKVTPNMVYLASVHQGFIPLSPSAREKDDRTPESSINFETGVRYADETKLLEAIAFYSDYEAIIKECTTVSTCRGGRTHGSEQQAGNTEFIGLELRSKYNLEGENVNVPLELSYTYTNAEFKEDFRANKAGDKLANVPENKLSASIGVESATSKAYLKANYTDGFCANRNDGCNRTKNARGKTEALLTFDVVAHKQAWQGGTIFGKLENITNNQKIVNYAPWGARPNMPLTFTIGVNQEF